MLFIKNHKKKGNDIPNENVVAILNKWKAFKQKIADRLQEKSELLSSKAKKHTLILFCLLFGGSSILIIVHSLTTKSKTIKIASISKPAHTNDGGQSMLQTGSIITRQEYNRVIQLETYLLSLRSDSLGKKKYDSIIISRPHIMDSIKLFKKMFLSQNKK